jgi:hypothetical protein
MDNAIAISGIAGLKWIAALVFVFCLFRQLFVWAGLIDEKKK